MKLDYKKIILGTALIAVLALPIAVGAQGTPPPPLDDTFTGGAADTDVAEVGDFQTLLSSIVGWVQIFFYVVATLMIILAAWDYLTSGGNEEKISGAKNKVIYAVVAIAIAVIAGGIVRLVENFVNT